MCYSTDKNVNTLGYSTRIYYECQKFNNCSVTFTNKGVNKSIPEKYGSTPKKKIKFLKRIFTVIFGKKIKKKKQKKKIIGVVNIFSERLYDFM